MTATADALMAIFGFKRVEGKQMKTDRELLELAAKAAGYRYMPANGCIVVDGIPGNWNPLTDDGDALRLAVLLRLDLNINDGECDVFSSDGFVNERDEDTDSATRRAIVRAAAAIGEGMQ